MNNRLLHLPHRSAVVLNPLDSPLDSLAPPVRVRVEGAEVDVLELELGVEITAISPVVRPIVRFHVETALTPCGDEVVRVEALDVGAHLVVPRGDQFRSAVLRARQVADAVGAAAGFVGEFPGEDCGGIFVAGNHCFDVFLEGCFDLGKAVELCLWIVGVSDAWQTKRLRGS